MATFRCNDIDGFCLSMSEFAQIPESTIIDMLQAGGEIVKEAHKQKISSEFSAHTGRLMGSPKVFQKTGGNGFKSRYALIYPSGQHHTYHAKKGKGIAMNNDVGFVQEFGGHGNAAHQWMQIANEQCADKMTDAEEKAYDSWLKSIGL